MRLPRMRVRTMMLAVMMAAALMGACMKLRARRELFKGIAEYHSLRILPASRWKGGLVGAIKAGVTPESYARVRATLSWHQTMKDKYAYHARYPWLPVTPGPPRPNKPK